LSLLCGEQKQSEFRRVKYWEIIVNKIIQAGFSVGWVSALDDYGRTVLAKDSAAGNSQG
jgi:hypothetical protein